MQICRLLRQQMVFIGLARNETGSRNYLNLRNFVILYILCQYMCLSVNYLWHEAITLTEYSDSIQVSATTTVNFSIFLFMVLELHEMYDLMDDFQKIIEKSEFVFSYRLICLLNAFITRRN